MTGIAKEVKKNDQLSVAKVVSDRENSKVRAYAPENFFEDEKDMTKRATRVLLLVPVLLVLSFCASRADLIGNWKEVGKGATIEFSKDGVFKAVDNQGMAVSGKYTLLKDGHLRCEIHQEGRTAEVVNVTISIKGDELTLTSPDHRGVERYRRER